MNATELVRAYYAAFNAADMETFLGLLHPEIVHDINQGRRETGREAFARFMTHMNRCYHERLEDIVVMGEPTGQRVAAEFVVHGSYIASDEGLPPASGQSYVLPAGAFFEIRDGKVARVTNYYNLNDWIRQVGA